MDIIGMLFSLMTNLDATMITMVQSYGIFVYLILFLIVFLETGVVFTPFLPGDSLLFIAGALASTGMLDIYLLFILLAAAAILGDSANYFIGTRIGRRLVRSGRVKKEYIKKTEDFYDRHGGKTIALARFMPIVRTFAPFVAGIGKMKYRRFLTYNVAGGLLWVSLFLFAGFHFGNLPVISDNLTLVILTIIFLSFIPGIVGFLAHRSGRKSGKKKPKK
jgi:membrane-associated protein